MQFWSVEDHIYFHWNWVKKTIVVLVYFFSFSSEIRFKDINAKDMVIYHTLMIELVFIVPLLCSQACFKRLQCICSFFLVMLGYSFSLQISMILFYPRAGYSYHRVAFNIQKKSMKSTIKEITIQETVGIFHLKWWYTK